MPSACLPRTSVRDPLSVADARLRFNGVPASLAAWIGAHGTLRSLATSQLVFAQHDPEDFVAWIVGGEAHLLLQGMDGRELILDSCGPGEMVGETALIAPRRRSFSARAATPLRILSVSSLHFAELQSDAAFMRDVLMKISLRLRQVAFLIESACLHRAEGRLARHLLRLADERGQAYGDGTTIVPMPTNQSVLAAMTHLSRPKLNSQLQQWIRLGVVRPHRRGLHLCSLDYLRCCASGVVAPG